MKIVGKVINGHPFHTSFQTSYHHIDTPSQYTLLTRSLNTPSQCTQLMHSYIGGLSRIYNRYRILPSPTKTSSSSPSSSPSTKKANKPKVVNSQSGSGYPSRGSLENDIDADVVDIDVDIMAVATSLRYTLTHGG